MFNTVTQMPNKLNTKAYCILTNIFWYKIKI